jgi:probable rRNA maturation factor
MKIFIDSADLAEISVRHPVHVVESALAGAKAVSKVRWGVSVHLVVEEGPHPGVASADVLRRVRAMLAAVQMGHLELSVLLTGDDQIRKLNKIYRKIDRPTDVLAFAQREGELGGGAGRLLGDVVVSVPTARRQADARGIALTSELTTLLAHGVLHLLGWDHDTPAKDRRMRGETDRLCAVANDAARSLRVKGKTGKHPNGDSIGRRAARTAR